jgi:hypothetical protein
MWIQSVGLFTTNVQVSLTSVHGGSSVVDHIYHVRCEVFTAVTVKNAVVWDAMPYCYCKNRRFIIMVERIRELVTANVFPSSLILFNMMRDAMHSSETSVLTRATRCHIPEDDILHVCHICIQWKFWVQYTFVVMGPNVEISWVMIKMLLCSIAVLWRSFRYKTIQNGEGIQCKRRHGVAQ